MAEVGFVWFVGIPIQKRLVTIGIRLNHIVQDTRLNHGKTFGSAIREVQVHLLASQIGKEMPRGVAQIKERFSIRVLKPAMVGAHLQPGSVGGTLSEACCAESGCQETSAEQEGERAVHGVAG